MGWLTIIQLMVRAIASVSEYLSQKQLLQAGEYKAISEGLRQTLDNVLKAKRASDEVATNPDGDYASGVREKYTRSDE